MSSAVAGILTALGGLGSSIINNLERRNAAELTRDYNSPSSQVQRLKKAGLNPYALAPQIASNNQGEFPAGSVDAGGDIASGISAGRGVEQTRINKRLAGMQLGQMSEQLRGLQLDNAFKALTIQDRAQFLRYKNNLAALDARLKSGEITIQQYKQEQERLTTEWQQWNAGIVSETYGDPHLNFDGEDLPDIANANAEYTRKNAIANIQTVEATLKKDIREYVTDQMKYKKLYTYQQYLYMIDHAVRESIARRYEENTNMPWSSKDMWVHLLDGVLTSLRKVLPESDGFGDAVVNAFFDYLGLPRPKISKDNVTVPPNKTGRMPGETPLYDYTPSVMKPAGTFGIFVPN